MFNLSQYCFSCFIIFSTVSGDFLILCIILPVTWVSKLYTSQKTLFFQYFSSSESFSKMVVFHIATFPRDFFQFSQLFQGTFLLQPLLFKGLSLRNLHFLALFPPQNAKKHILFQKMCSSTYQRISIVSQQKSYFQLFQGTFFDFCNFFKGLFTVFSTFPRDFSYKVPIFPRDFSFFLRTSHFYSSSTASVQSRKYWSSGSKWSPLLPQFRKNLWKHRYKSESSALQSYSYTG